MEKYKVQSTEIEAQRLKLNGSREIKNLSLLPGYKEAIAALWALEYWKRLWVLPEILNAQTLVVQAGPMVSQWPTLVCTVDDDSPYHVQNILFERVTLHAIDPTSSKDGPLISHGTAFTQCVLQIRETH